MSSDLNIVEFVIKHVKEFYGYNETDEIPEDEMSDYILEFFGDSDKCELIDTYDYDLDEYTICYNRLFKLDERYIQIPDVYYPSGYDHGDEILFDYKTEIIEMVPVPGIVFEPKK